MEIKKVNLDRQNLSSSYIEKKQDFNHVLKSAKMTKMPTWKSPWFYGAVGLSTVAIVAVVLMENNFKNETNDKTATLKEKNKEIGERKSTNTNPSIEKKTSSSKTIVAAYNPQFTGSSSSVKNDYSLKTELSKDEVVTAIEEQLPITETPVETVKETKSVTKTSFIGQPSIAGIASGVISIEKFKNTSIIESNSSFEITSYEVQYFNGQQDITAVIRSNKIPENIKEQIIENNLDEMIFITGIKGIDENGKIRKLPAINLKLSK
jgi:hypothetical protein